MIVSEGSRLLPGVYRRRAASTDAGGRPAYQHSRCGRLQHAARQTRHRQRGEKVTHQTSPTPDAFGIFTSLAPRLLNRRADEEGRSRSSPKRGAARDGGPAAGSGQ